MSLALAVPGQPCVPRNGVYFRMEDDNFTQRFKNHLRMEILDDIAYVVYPRSRPKKTYTLTLTPADDACMIDWTPLNNTWEEGRLQFVCAEGVPGLLEDGAKFWKLSEEYSTDIVARRKIQLETQSPLALTDAGTAAGASDVRPRDPRKWLGSDPGARVHAGWSEEVPLADASSQRNVRQRFAQEDASQNPSASSRTPDESCVLDV